METITLNFKASGQNLTADAHPQRYASNTVNYIQAVFDLDDNWKSFDSVRAVWHNEFACISTVLDSDGACTVPHEVLTNLDEVIVNLVGSDVDGEELVDRMTTYPLRVAIIDAHARICGTETAEVTPSQFEQYVAIVSDLVHSVKDIDRIELNEDYTLTVYFSDETSWTSTSIRGEQGETGNGIASAVLNDDYTLTLTFTDGTSYTTSSIRGAQGPQGEPGDVTLAQLASVLPTDTASGAIASFEDGSDLFDYLSCICEINPVQDLHGYDKPWVGGAGKNKFPSLEGTANTVTFTKQNDGTVFIHGTATSTSWTFQQEYYDLPYNGIVAGGNISAYTDKYLILQFYNGSTQVGTALSPANGVKYGTVPAEATKIRVIQYPEQSQTQAGTVYNTVAHYYVGTDANGTFTSWTPYSNICPITGWTGCEVTDCGVNFIDKTKIVLGERFNASGTASVASSFARTELIRVKPSTDYYFTNVTSSNTWSCVWWYDEYGRNISWAGISGTGTVSGTKTSPANAYYVGINIYASDIDTTMLTEGTTAPSSYIPYNGTTYPITWQTEAGTVYGGTVDLVTGVLTAYPYYTSYNGETLVGPWVSSIDEYIEGRIPTTGAQVVDLGGTPTTYQLTPTQIHALLGQNNVWADCGDVEVQYKADVQRWVDKMLNA